MAVRSAQEIITSLRGIMGEQTPEGYENLLEDITDSVTAPDMSGYVTKDEYDRVVGERDGYKQSAADMRTKYINRFYSDYSQPNDKAYIDSSASQTTLEKDEKMMSYDDLFE